MKSETDTTEAVIATIVETLGIHDRAAELDVGTPLLDSLPELDSMAIVALIVALEDRFGIEIDEDDITGDVFESVGTLARFVDDHLG